MELIRYYNRIEFLRDINPCIDENFISHYLLFEATNRLFNRKEVFYFGCTVKSVYSIEIIYFQTNMGHYFFGTTKNKLAIDKLLEAISIEQFDKDSNLFGYTFIIDSFINKNRFRFKNIRHRYYMSLKPCNLDIKNVEGKLCRANEHDYEALVPLILGFYNEEFEGNGAQTDEKVSSDFKNGLKAKGTYYWKIDNQITTLINTMKFPGERIYIPSIYTIPNFRKKGISKSAFGTLIKILLDLDYKEIGLNVKAKNEEAIGLFSSLGMKRIYETGIYKI